MLAFITENVPDLRPVFRVLHWSPDSLSMCFPPHSRIPLAVVCFHDVEHTLAEARLALIECYAHAIYYRIVAAPANELTAVFWERYYNNDLAHRLYAAAEHLAAGIEAMLEIRPEVLNSYRRSSRVSRQALVAAFLRRAEQNHRVTRSVRRLGRCSDWHRAMSYRGALVHEQPPLMEGTGIVYTRGPRWQRTASGGNRLAVGGGDEPALNTETVADVLHRAMLALVDTFRECVDSYLAILADQRITVSDTGVTLRL